MPSIKNNDELDKLVSEALLKHGYRVIKVGSGNYITNPTLYNSTPPQDATVFKYDYKKCSICSESPPEPAVLEDMLDQAVAAHS